MFRCVNSSVQGPVKHTKRMYQASERSAQRKEADRQSFDSEQAWGSPRTGLSKWSDSQGGSPWQRCCRCAGTTFVWWSRKESLSYQFRETNHRRLQGVIPEKNSSFSKDFFFFISAITFPRHLLITVNCKGGTLVKFCLIPFFPEKEFLCQRTFPICTRNVCHFLTHLIFKISSTFISYFVSSFKHFWNSRSLL